MNKQEHDHLFALHEKIQRIRKPLKEHSSERAVDSLMQQRFPLDGCHCHEISSQKLMAQPCRCGFVVVEHLANVFDQFWPKPQ